MLLMVKGDENRDVEPTHLGAKNGRSDNQIRRQGEQQHRLGEGLIPGLDDGRWPTTGRRATRFYGRNMN